MKKMKLTKLAEQEIRECTCCCKNCGHSITFKATTKWTICSYCGHKALNNSKARFKYEYINAKRKIEGEVNGKEK